VTRERIRQIEAKALRRLMHPARLDRFLVELGLTPKPPHGAEMGGDSDDKGDGSAQAEQAKVTTKPKEPAQVAARPERKNSSEPTALDKLLDQAREAGIAVEDYTEGDARRIWVYITEAPDNRSRRLVRKFIELGFEFWPGKGYWR